MAVFTISGNKSQQQCIQIAEDIAFKYDGKFEFGVVSSVFIKFKTAAREKAAVDAVNKSYGGVTGVTKKEYNKAAAERLKQAPKRDPVLSKETHLKIAKHLISSHSELKIDEIFNFVTDALWEESNGTHNALDQYQVEGCLKDLLGVKDGFRGPNGYSGYF